MVYHSYGIADRQCGADRSVVAHGLYVASDDVLADARSCGIVYEDYRIIFIYAG